MGNPALFPLVDECDARDLVIVKINPMQRQKLPRTASEIHNRINEITFNASLMKELRALGFLWEVIHYEAWNGKSIATPGCTASRRKRRCSN